MKNGYPKTTTTDPTEAFLQTFFAIDRYKDEVVTKNQVNGYAETKKWDREIVQKWMNLFKSRNSDRITLEDICDYLRLNIKEVRKQRDSPVKSEKPPISNSDNKQLGSDIEVIIDQMPMDMKIPIVNEFRKVLSKSNNYNSDKADFDGIKATEHMKDFMDKRFSSSWVALIVKGSYTATFVYFEECSFQFRINNYNCIVWRTFIGFN
ncbi:unnamed protein product [Trichobilharzia szidati]|nr:unnamed protein product [Trichobilharzia szidati]